MLTDVSQEGIGIALMTLHILPVFDRSKQGEQILLELQADELFTPNITHSLWSTGIGYRLAFSCVTWDTRINRSPTLVPGVIDCLRNEVYPSPIRG